MKLDKGLIAGSSTLLVLSLLEKEDMYGYQMITELSRRSNDTFQMKEGTLYPILHALEKGKVPLLLQQEAPTGRCGSITPSPPRGRELLSEKKAEWAQFSPRGGPGPLLHLSGGTPWERKQERTPAEGWLDKATAGIRFGPDRKEVRRELEEHLEGTRPWTCGASSRT